MNALKTNLFRTRRVAGMPITLCTTVLYDQDVEVARVRDGHRQVPTKHLVPTRIPPSPDWYTITDIVVNGRSVRGIGTGPEKTVTIEENERGRKDLGGGFSFEHIVD